MKFVTTPGPLQMPGPVILAIDPGSRKTGFAFIQATKSGALLPRDLRILDAGVLTADPDMPHWQRIGLLHGGVCQLIERHRPSVCVLEKAFYDKNASSALKLGEVRGAYIAALGRYGVHLEELTPAQVKKTIAGNGRADKEQVSLSVETLTGFRRGHLPHDVTDAVAIGLAFGLGLLGKWSPLETLKGVSAHETR